MYLRFTWFWPLSRLYNCKCFVMGTLILHVFLFSHGTTGLLQISQSQSPMQPFNCCLSISRNGLSKIKVNPSFLLFHVNCIYIQYSVLEPSDGPAQLRRPFGSSRNTHRRMSRRRKRLPTATQKATLSMIEG